MSCHSLSKAWGGKRDRGEGGGQGEARRGAYVDLEKLAC